MTASFGTSLKPAGEPGRGLSGIEWVICIIAANGFAFDTFALLTLPLILRPALIELGGLKPGSPGFAHWFALLFYVPAVCGGIFGLLGGYLTDLFGRRRVLTWSISVYAISALASGYATSLPMLLVLRCTTFIPVCVEFVAAVAWLAELFQAPARRERVLGYTQAFGSIGGALVAWANSICIHIDPVKGWRYTLMAGLIPALPLLLIRPFLPESPVWKEKKAAGTLRRPSIAELFAPGLRRTTLVTTAMFACSLGAAFGALQQMPQIVPGVPEVQASIKAAVAALPALPEKGKKKETGAAGPSKAATVPTTPLATSSGKPAEKPGAKPASDDPRVKPITGNITQVTAAEVTKLQEYGGLVGRIIFALLVVRFISRKMQIRTFQLPGLIVIPVVFSYAAVHGLDSLKAGMFVAGLVTVSQLSFWGNYLPHVFPVHLRGTGESFAANIGGRMIGTGFAALTGLLAAKLTPAGSTIAEAAHYWSYTAAGVGFAAFFIGFLLSFLLPEPPAEPAEARPAGPGFEVLPPAATGRAH